MSFQWLRIDNPLGIALEHFLCQVRRHGKAFCFSAFDKHDGGRGHRM